MNSLATRPDASPKGAGRPDAGRRRNPRGMGRLLADEIVEGALRLIDQGTEAESITLRAVAREVGISAPSIYAHFRDRDEILLAAARRLFDEIRELLMSAGESAPEDAASRLLAGCRAYVDFGLESPARYRTMFSCEIEAPRNKSVAPTLDDFARGEAFVGAEAFLVLVGGIEDCVRAGVSTSTDPAADAVAIWLYLHGLVSLRNDLPQFPWPPVDEMLDVNVGRLACLRTAA